MMSSRTIGYVRVSSIDQCTDRQLADVKLDKIFTDKASGKDAQRPELQKMLDFSRDGDTIIVHSMDRLARNLDDLRKLVKNLTERGIKLQFVKENLTFTGEDNPMSVLLMSVMGAFAEFERSLIKERQKEGIAAAKNKGVYRGRKKALTSDEAKKMLARIQAGEKKAVIARDYGISRETLYQYLKAAD
jgi:DNA invertase Pin-like site-specific DNA recombinase